MPQLSELFLQEIKIPNTDGGICHIGLTYGDICDIESGLYGKVEFETGKDAKQKINGSALSTEKELIMTLGIKSWNFTDVNGATLPITMENIRKLSREQGDFVYTELRKLYEIKATDESKKK